MGPAFKRNVKLVLEPGNAARLVDDLNQRTLILTVLEGQVLALMGPDNSPESLTRAARAAGLDVDVRQVESLLKRAETNGFIENRGIVRFKGEAPDLGLDDVVPPFRADLIMKSGAKAGLVRLYEPESGSSVTLHDFEIHVARLLDGKHKVHEVIALAAKIGISITPESLKTFIAQMSTYGLMSEWWSEAVRPAATKTWPPRAKWTADIRELFQSALRQFRQGKAEHALEYLDMLLEIQPGTPEGLELRERVRAKIAGTLDESATFESLHGTGLTPDKPAPRLTQDAPLPRLTPEPLKPVELTPMLPVKASPLPRPPDAPLPIRMKPPTATPAPPPPEAPLAIKLKLAPAPPPQAAEPLPNRETEPSAPALATAAALAPMRPEVTDPEAAPLGAAPPPEPFVPSLSEVEAPAAVQPKAPTNPSQPAAPAVEEPAKPKKKKSRAVLMLLLLVVIGALVPLPALKGVPGQVRPVVLADAKVAGGTFHTLLAKPGQHVDVGAPLADLDTDRAAEEKQQLEKKITQLDAAAKQAEEGAKPKSLPKAEKALAKAQKALLSAPEDKKAAKLKAFEKAQKAYDEANGLARAAEMRALVEASKLRVRTLQKEIDGAMVTAPVAGAFEPGAVPPAGSQFEAGAVIGHIVDEHRALLVGTNEGASEVVVGGKRLKLDALKHTAQGIELPYDGPRPQTVDVQVRSGWAPWTIRYLPFAQEWMSKLTKS
jgi:hypothetical protein